MLDVDGPPSRRCWDSRAFLSAMFRSSFNFFLSLFFLDRVYIIGKDFYRNFFFRNTYFNSYLNLNSFTW